MPVNVFTSDLNEPIVKVSILFYLLLEVEKQENFERRVKRVGTEKMEQKEVVPKVNLKGLNNQNFGSDNIYLLFAGRPLCGRYKGSNSY